MNESTQDFILNNSSNSTEITKIINYTSDFTNNSLISFLNTSNTTSIISQIDPNWFYSASAQSAAAIVGLMGAFLTTKVLNQKIYLKQLGKEINELEMNRDHISDEITHIKYLKENLLNSEPIKVFLPQYPHFSPSTIPSNNMIREIESREDGKQCILNLTKYREYETDIVTKNIEHNFLNNLSKHKQEQMFSNKDILDSIRHLKSLAIFSVLGVFLPLGVMLFDFDIMMELRLITFLLILIGWIYILFTLGNEIHNLKD